MKQTIKAFLKKLPIVKQFLAKIERIENHLSNQIIHNRQEIRNLKTALQMQNQELNKLKDLVHTLQTENAEQKEKLVEYCSQIKELNARCLQVCDQVECLKVDENIKEINQKIANYVDLNHIKRLEDRLDSMYRQMNYLYYKGLHPDSYEEALGDWYYQRTGEGLDLSAPKTYNEKIQWIKMFDNTLLKTRLTDKYLVREWIAEKIGDEYLIPLLGVWKTFDEIDFEKLPAKFVLKANHGSGWNVIVKDKNKINIQQLKAKFDLWLKQNYAFFGLELHYKGIHPLIIAEQYLEDLEQVYDYKFMCFDGVVKFVWVDTGRFSNHRRTLFTPDWIKMEEVINWPSADELIPRPDNYDKMLKIATTLCQGFSHVRVDLYNVKGKIYFGEMTFTSDSGTAKIVPKEFGKTMGDWLNLPSNDVTD